MDGYVLVYYTVEASRIHLGLRQCLVRFSDAFKLYSPDSGKSVLCVVFQSIPENWLRQNGTSCSSTDAYLYEADVQWFLHRAFETPNERQARKRRQKNMALRRKR